MTDDRPGSTGSFQRLLFHFPPETVHDLIAWILKVGGRLGWGRWVIERFWGVADERLNVQLFGIDFPNPVGLAAGWDKNAIAVPIWSSFGFGFVEVGSITAVGQSGNPQPRLFRLKDDLALINRMGFNNDGAEKVAKRLEGFTRRRLLRRIPIGINLGKSRVTPIDRAVDDYLFSLERLYPFGDYFAINVSSPNTPGLRQLQDRGRLEELLAGVQEKNRGLAGALNDNPKPILVKIAPDLTEPQIDEVLSVVERWGVAGIIATNTTVSREGLRTLVHEEGGLSGRPLRSRSTEIIRYIRCRTGGRLPTIGVGGILTADDAYEKIRAGASLVQLYTGLVYGGPGVVKRICKGLIELMEHDGVQSLGKIEGS